MGHTHTPPARNVIEMLRIKTIVLVIVWYVWLIYDTSIWRPKPDQIGAKK